MDFSKLSLNDLRDFLESYEQIPSDDPEELANQASQLYELAYTTYGDDAVYPESVLDLFLATNYLVNGGTVDQSYHPSYLEQADHEFLEALSMAFDLSSTSSEDIDDETARRRVTRILTILGAVENDDNDDELAEEFLRTNGPLEERYDPLTILYDNGSLALDFATALGLPQEDTPWNRNRIIRFLKRLNGLWTEADYNTEIVTLAQNYLDQGGSIDQTYTETEIYNFDTDTIAVFTSLFGLLPVDIPEIRSRIIGILRILGVVHPANPDQPDDAQIKSVVRPNTPIISPVVPETVDSPIPLTPVKTPSFIPPLTGPQVSLVSSDEIPIVDEVVADEPVIEEPLIEEPLIEEPLIEEPVIEEPVTEEPIIEELVIEEPLIEEPLIEEPVIEEPVTEEPVTEEPLIEEPVTEIVAEEPLIEELLGQELTLSEIIENEATVCEEIEPEVTVCKVPLAEIIRKEDEIQVEEPIVEVTQVEEPIVEVTQVEEPIVEVTQVEEPIVEVIEEEEPIVKVIQVEEVTQEVIEEKEPVVEITLDEVPGDNQNKIPEVTLVEEILSIEEVANVSPIFKYDVKTPSFNESISILLTEQSSPSHVTSSPLKLPSSIDARSSPSSPVKRTSSPSTIRRQPVESILSPSAATPRVGLLVDLPDPVDLIIEEEPLPGTLTPIYRSPHSPYSPQTIARGIPLPDSPSTPSLYQARTPSPVIHELSPSIGPRVTLSPRANPIPTLMEDEDEENMSPFIMIGSPPLIRHQQRIIEQEEGMMSPDSSLVSASGKGDLNAIEAAVDSGALAFNQAFLKAATSGQEEVVSELITKHFGDITQTIIEQSTEIAGEHGHLGVLEDLIAYDDSLNGRAAHGLGLGGHLEQLEKLELTKYAGDFLVGAAQGNHLEIVQQTLNKYPDISTEMKDRALLSAALADQDSEIYLLLFRQGGTAKGLKEAYGQALTRGGHPNSVKRLRTLVPN